MVYDYVITLKRPDTRLADWVSTLLYFISFVCFIYFGFFSGELEKGYLLIAAGILACWIWNWYKRKISLKVYYTNGLSLAALGWFALGDHHNAWFGLLYIVAALVEREFKFTKEIGFSTEDITVNSLMKKRYYWGEVNNAMIKEGIVTIDFKNNKIIQKEIADEVAPATEAEFNAFCKSQLERKVAADQGPAVF